MLKRLLIAVVVALLLAAGTRAAAGRPAWTAEVDKLFAAFDRPGSPGCALGIFKDGKMLYERGYGSADLEHDVPITPDSVFYAGSVSKQFTAMTVAVAIKQGLFRLDDDARKYVPELPAYESPILVRHLLHHTSGLRDINTLVSAAGQRDEVAFDNDAVLRVLSRQRALNFAPGSEYLYSNSGYAVLALIVERTAKIPFAAFADAHVFKPLGMTVSHFHTDLGRLVPGRAYAYDRPPGGAAPRLNTPQNERAGAGGLFTTVRELLLWDENFYTGRVGGKDVIAQLETTEPLNSGAVNRYAWGLQIATYRGLPVVEHSGSLGGYRAQVFRVRDHHFSVALLCNVSSANPTEISHRIADIYLAPHFKEAAPVAPAAATRPAGQRPADVPAYPPEDLAAFAGTFASEELDTTYRVVAEKGQLVVFRGVEKQPIRLQASGLDEFRAQSAVLKFTRPDGKRAAGFVLDAGRIRGIAFTRKD